MATEFNVEKHATQILQQGNISEEVSDNFLRYFCFKSKFKLNQFSLTQGTKARDNKTGTY